MTKMIVSVSIVSADFTRLGEQVREVENAGADWIHVDVMDGHFVPNLTMGPFIVETIRRITNLPLDVHLMVDNPDVMIPWYANAGATRISVQIETCPHIFRTLQFIRSHNCIPGVVLNPGTPAGAIQAVLGLAELVLVMTVNPGFSGQTFIPEVLPKIIQVRKMIEAADCPVLIQVDGGITPANIKQTYQAGARVFVSATSIFSHPQGISAGIMELRKAAS